MKRIDLVQSAHNRKIGEECEYIEPNITEDCIFYSNGEPIGFYVSKMPAKMCKLADLANTEFKSDNVPKTKMDRSDVLKAQIDNPGMTRSEAREIGTCQMSTIIGSVPPKPQFMRHYPTRSSVHTVKSAQTFIKAMLMLAKESETLIAQIMPEQHARQLNIFKDVPSKWKFGNLFTSSISNFNISAPFHRDTGNMKDTVNVIICKKLNAKGGDLHIPDYGATIGQQDNSVLVYPAWRNMHGVTPINPVHPGGVQE
jgi:hypothetical protein